MSNDHVHQLAGAYALDALPSDEEAFFRRHLADCEACRADVAEYQATAAELGLGEATEPPPGLRERILAEVDRTPQRPRITAGSGAPWRRRLLAAAAAVVVLFAGVGIGTTIGGRQPAPSGDPAWLASADVVALDAPTGADAQLLYSSEAGEAMFVAEGLEPVDPDESTYQLWVLRGETPEPAGLFTPDETGDAVAALTASVEDADAVAVTVEPAGGVDAPTGDILIRGALES